MLEGLIITLAILVTLILILCSWIWGGYNTFIRGTQNVKTMWSDIKTEYQRRADLLLNLAEAVRSYAKFEKSTLVDVIAMRQGKFGNNKMEDMKKMKGLEAFMSKLMVVVEKYPKLLASKQYQILMHENRITEDRVNIARTNYNDVVRDYNLTVKSFPSNILARAFGFNEENFYENDKETDKAPRLKIDI